MREPEIAFNMDLANGSTSERFCYEAAAVLNMPESAHVLCDYCRAGVGEYEHAPECDTDNLSEIVDEWTNALETAGYAVRWDAGDVVVWDLRDFTDDERDAFYETLDY